MLDYSRLPKHMQGTVRRYIEDGILPGSFLTAVICNKLQESFTYADETNIEKMFDIVGFFCDEAPFGCWGSKKDMTHWIEKGGLNGHNV